MIAIVDYGMGNIHSVNKALRVLGARTVVTGRKEDISHSSAIVLPGVGAFDDAMLALKAKGLVVFLKDEISKGKPFLGICLGMQLLFEKSEEGREKGLGVIPGKVVKFSPKRRLKVPHIGWDRIKGAQCPVSSVKDGQYVYFCHSYYAVPKDKEVVAATADYGVRFAAMVVKENIFGMQFHPEKSQMAGLRILKSFLNTTC
jgi:glutamine amidotransferase